MHRFLLVGVFFMFLVPFVSNAQEKEVQKQRARVLGVKPGILHPGKWNAITDVKGVKVGHKTLIKGDSVRTGVTAIIPHEDNVFQKKVPAAVYVGNGFGKAMGTTQIEELGNIETPIALTNTLNAPKIGDALISYMLHQEGNENIQSVNPVVGETNDGFLNDIRSRHVEKKDLITAIKRADSGAVDEGNVGAGTGTVCMGFKGGIGTSSRILPKDKGGYTVGVLVQTNFGGILSIDGAPVGKELGNHYMSETIDQDADGSAMIIIATDAPLSARNLKRLAKRSFLAFGKVGSFSSNGSGDYSIAFSVHPDTYVAYDSKEMVKEVPHLSNDAMSPLFLAVLEATEEAIYNSLFMASDMSGYKGNSIKALPLDKTLDILEQYNVLQ